MQVEPDQVHHIAARSREREIVEKGRERVCVSDHAQNSKASDANQMIIMAARLCSGVAVINTTIGLLFSV